MSVDNVKAILEKMFNDGDFMERVEEIKTPAEFRKLLAEENLEITREDTGDYLKAISHHKLNKLEVDNIKLVLSLLWTDE